MTVERTERDLQHQLNSARLEVAHVRRSLDKAIVREAEAEARLEAWLLEHPEHRKAPQR